MDRDTKIGLVLALAFVGLVGAVLYHKMENPEQLYAGTPAVIAPPVQTPPADPTPANATSGQAQANATTGQQPSFAPPEKVVTDEPPPPAPPATSVPVVKEQPKASTPIQPVASKPPSEAPAWSPLGQTGNTILAKNDKNEPPPEPAPPTQVQPPPKPTAPPPSAPPPAAPAVKKDNRWFAFWSRGKKQEPTKPTGLAGLAAGHAPPPMPPAQPPAQQEPPPLLPPIPTTPGRQVAGNEPPPPDSGFRLPGPPSATNDSRPPLLPPVQKNEQPFLPPVQKNEQPFLPPVKEQPQPPSMTPPVQQQFIPKNDPPKRSEPQITHLPPKKETPPAPPAVTFNEPQITQPPTKQVPATPVVEQRENRPTVLKDVKPLPPSNTYDRRYPPPVKLGAPREDNGTPAPSPLGNTTSTGGGQPVRIRMQPDLPPSREGIPVVTRPTSPSPTTDRPRLPVQVESTELRAYSPVQGDTYATISARFYGNDKYSAALAQFNVDKERDNRFSSVWPGQRIFIPAREYLERRYAAQIANTSQRPAARSPLDATGPTSRYLPPMETASAGAKEKLTTPVTAERTKSGNKSEYVRYMVREKDSLFSIAKKKLGNGDRWTEIYALNKELVPDPNKPETGVVLKLPADAKLDNAGSPE